jgi:hypothetical protein
LRGSAGRKSNLRVERTLHARVHNQASRGTLPPSEQIVQVHASSVDRDGVKVCRYRATGSRVLLLEDGAAHEFRVVADKLSEFVSYCYFCSIVRVYIVRDTLNESHVNLGYIGGNYIPFQSAVKLTPLETRKRRRLRLQKQRRCVKHAYSMLF